LRNVLFGKGTDSQNHVIAANTALALQCYKPEENIQDLFSTSLDFIKSGEAGRTHFPNFK
jgi:anthranilate phosphoribosyltransferase